MISNTVMLRSQILLFAGYLCAQNREVFSAQIVLQLKTQTAFLIKREMAKVHRPTNSMKIVDDVCCFMSSHYARGKELSMRSTGIQPLQGYMVLVKQN